MDWEEYEKLLEENGWTVECQSPFEIRHENGCFATGGAAHIVLGELIREHVMCYDKEDMGLAFKAGHERGVYVASVITGKPIDGHYPQFSEFMKNLRIKKLQE